MRALGWFAALLLNGAVLIGALMLTVESEAPIGARYFGVVAAALSGIVVVLLVLVQVERLPRWGVAAMRYACIAHPVLWFVGSIDHGILSGLEIVSVVIVASLAWGTWRVFTQFQPKV